MAYSKKFRLEKFINKSLNIPDIDVRADNYEVQKFEVIVFLRDCKIVSNLNILVQCIY